MDKAKKCKASNINENIEMRITSWVEEVLKDSSSDEEINKHLKHKDFDAIKKQINSSNDNYSNFTHLNFGGKKENEIIKSSKKFGFYGQEEKEQQSNYECGLRKHGKDYAEEGVPHKAFLNDCLTKPNEFEEDKNIKDKIIENNNFENEYTQDESVQDEIKFKSSHENLFYLNKPFLLENKGTKGKSNRKVFNSHLAKELENLDEDKEHNLNQEIEEIQERKIQNNSYSAKALNLSKLGFFNYEIIEVPKKFNSYELSNLWQSFPFRNKSNASKKSQKIENSSNKENKDLVNSKEKEAKKDNNEKSKFLKENGYSEDSIIPKDKEEIINTNKSSCKTILNYAGANHFCNIDIHNKYLSKGFSFQDNSNSSNLLHSNNFINQASKEIQENLGNENTRGNLQQPTIEELLDKIKHSERINKESIKNLRGKIVKILKSQNGSRILQNSLLNDSYMIIKTILTEVEDHLSDLMVDPYANYFCQKLYEHLKLQDRLLFLKKIIGSIKGIATNKIGTYPLQSVIHHMKNNEEKKLIVYGILPSLKEISMDSQGTHVIEKLIICFDELTNMEIINYIIENFIVFANNINSLCIIKKLIVITKNYEIRKKILDKITGNLDNLIQNAHGNYSIQVALEICDGFYSMPIINEISGKYHKYSLLKYSSNVIERCLEIGGENTVHRFIEEMCQKNKVLDLLKNSFGNYVVQKALKLSSGNLKNKLINYIKKSVEKLTDKKLISKWTSIIEANKGSANLAEAPEKPISRIKSNDSLFSNKSSNSNFSSNFNTKKNNLDNSFNSNICSVPTCAHSCKSFHCVFGNENAFLHNNANHNYNFNSNFTNNNNNYFSNQPQPPHLNNLNSFNNLNVNFNNYIGNYNNTHLQSSFANSNKNKTNNFFNCNKENLNTANRNINIVYNTDSNSAFTNNVINKTFYNPSYKNNLCQYNSNEEINRINENFSDLIIKDNITNYNKNDNNLNNIRRDQNIYLNEYSDKTNTLNYINNHFKTNYQRMNQVNDENLKSQKNINNVNNTLNIIDKENKENYKYANNANPCLKWN